MVTRIDGDVGRIMALLKKLDIDDNTIVFFCSDNGAQKRWDGLFDSSGPLRGCKGDLYEGGIRAPMIVHWPGNVPAGEVSDQVWYFADVVATAAELAGVKSPANSDGISVVPMLLAKKQNTNDRFLYWESYRYGFQQAVRWRNYKALRLSPGRPLQLYNLPEDVAEQHDIAARHPCIGDVRGRGLMIGVDFVKDRATREPNPQLRNLVLQEAFRRGLATLGCGETSIRVIPPLCIDQAQLETGLAVFEEAIAAAQAQYDNAG